jgi:ankyrin repeat protein
MYDTDVDMIDHSGSTPLHCVCQKDDLNILTLLLSVFARADITNSDKLTSIETAKFAGNNKLVPYISQLLDVTGYTPNSSTGADFTSTRSVTRHKN